MSRRFDVTVFFGGSALAAAAGISVVAFPALLVPLLWAWMLLLEGPHLCATLHRTYLDPRQRRERAPLLVGSLAFLAGPLVVYGIYRATGAAALFDALLLVAALWSYHHGVRQHYGIVAIYDAKARTPRVLWRFDKWTVTALLWALFGFSLSALPANHRVLGLDDETSRLLAAWAWPLALVCGALFLALAGSLVWRARRGLSLLPALFALGPVAALSVFNAVVIGAREPVFAAPSHPEHYLLAVTLVGGIVHGVHYLGVTTAAGLRRYRATDGERADDEGAEDADDGLAARLGRAPLLAWASFVVVSLAYLALDAAKATHPGVDLVAPGSEASRFFLALYWGVFFHHYYLDQRIWRVRGDDALRRELGLPRAEPT